ncbi:MAG TPA: DUF4129 domain-containing protein, partial [Roseiflexaceae bacterium]|nr:DUF4129 domain-containing protein [Roseiflexaceae bacterium]
EELQRLGEGRRRAAAGLLAFLPGWLALAVQVALALLPLVALLMLYLLRRRRPRQRRAGDEERVSLFSLEGVAADLRALLAGLGRRGEESGLRAALARLRGADPVSRVRRSYIRLLLAGEARERPRAPHQTPREYEPEAAEALPAAREPIAALTAAYERARYHPEATGAADADAAEWAWRAIERGH